MAHSKGNNNNKATTTNCHVERARRDELELLAALDGNAAAAAARLMICALLPSTKNHRPRHMHLLARLFLAATTRMAKDGDRGSIVLDPAASSKFEFIVVVVVVVANVQCLPS